jgi:hypothetical protein
MTVLLSGAITRARDIAGVPRIGENPRLESGTETVVLASNSRIRSPLETMHNGKYFGNFGTGCATKISSSDLLSATPEAASRAALKFRKDLNAELSPKTIAKKIVFFEDPRFTEPRGRITGILDIVLTSWCQFDLKGPKLDFGWGRPFNATGGRFGFFPPGFVYMFQDKDSGDVQTYISVEKEGGDILKSDELLNKYATLIPNDSSC